LLTPIWGAIGDKWEGLDTESFEQESQLAADEGLQPSTRGLSTQDQIS